jgi:aquaporin Z
MSNSVQAGGPSLAAILVAEATGVFALVFAGAGAVVVNGLVGGIITHVGIALTHGVVIGIMVYTFKDISGAHFNPAVTVAMIVDGKTPPMHGLGYILAQLGGAALATILHVLILSGSGVSDWGATTPALTPGAAFFFELVATFFLVTVIFGVVRAGERANPFAGIAIGGAILLGGLFAGPVSGASLNPARSFGPALFTQGAFASYWIYAVAPILGGLAAVAVHRVISPRG